MKTYYRLLEQATPTTLTGLKIVFKDYDECMAFDRERRAAGGTDGISDVKYYHGHSGKNVRWWAFIPTNLPIIHE